MATVALEAAWIDRTGGFLFVAWEMTVGNWLGAPVQSGTVPTIAVNGSAGPALTNHGVAKKGTSRWIARYSLATPVAAGATVTFTALSGSVANGAITSTPSATTAAVTNNSEAAATPTTVYVDMEGEPGGLGTEAFPFCSLNEAKVYLASGVTVYAKGGDVRDGTAHEWDGSNGLTINSLDGWTIAQWPWQAQCVLSGACPILGFDGNTTAGYRVDGMDVHPELIGYGVDDLFVATDAFNPKTGITKTFQWPSFGMEEVDGASEATQISNVQANTTNIGRWAYDSTNDRLWIHSTQGNGNPASDPYDYFVLMRSDAGGNVSNGISTLSCDNWTIDGLHVRHFMDRTTAYAIFGQTSTGARITNCRASCYGYHGIGFAANDCRDNTIDNFVIDTAAPTTDSAIVFYSSATDVSGCIAHYGEVHCNTILRWDATAGSRTPVRVGGASAYTNPTGSPGLAAHTSSGVTEIVPAGGVRYAHVDVYGYTDASNTVNPCFVFTGRHTAPVATELLDVYPVIITDCVFSGPVGGQCTDGGATAFDRCWFYGAHGSTNGIGTTDCWSRALNSEVLFRSCVFSITGEAGTVASAIIRSQNNDQADRAHVVMLGCTLYQLAANTALFDVRRDTIGTDVFGRLTARNCILRMVDGGSSTSRLIAGTTVTAAGGIRDRIVFAGNVYDVNIPNNNFGFPDSSINTQAEFTSAVDTTGIYDVDLSAAFASNVTLEPRFDSTLIQMIAPEATYFGIDTRNNRRYGAWQQYVPTLLRVRDTGRDPSTTRPILG